MKTLVSTGTRWVYRLTVKDQSETALAECEAIIKRCFPDETHIWEDIAPAVQGR